MQENVFFFLKAKNSVKYLYGMEVRYCSDRKEEKDHGADKGSFLGTKLQDGDRVVMIEDVTTSGKSMEETVPKVHGAANVEIVGLMVSLNRNEKGKGEKTALKKRRSSVCRHGYSSACWPVSSPVSSSHSPVSAILPRSGSSPSARSTSIF